MSAQPWSRDVTYPTSWLAPEPDPEPACHDVYIHPSPDCESGKHRACYGDAWCEHLDEPIGCECPCHAGDDDRYEDDSTI